MGFQPLASVFVLALLGFSSFFFLPPSIGGPPSPDAATTTTIANEPLQSMTTNKLFNTFASCFQNQCSGAIRYLFKPTGFAAWHNVGAGNVTLTGFTVGGQSRSVSAFSNSTTIDYRITVPNVVTMDIYFKEKPTNGRPSNTFKVTMIGTSSVSGTFTWNFGNPQSFPVTCDNTKKILTYGTAGLNFTDATNFSATCTATSVSFTIGIGAFQIDPSTITTVSTTAVTRQEWQNKAWWVPSLSLFAAFYSDGSKIVCRTSSNGQTWTSAATITSAITGAPSIDFWFIGSTVYYVRNSGTATGTFSWRYGTFSSGCSITWTISEASISTTGTSPLAPSITIDPTPNLWVALSTTQSAVAHMEVWECAGAVSSCTWTKSLDSSEATSNSGSTMIVSDSTFVAVIYGSASLSSSKASLQYSTNGGSSWSSVFQQSSNGILGQTGDNHAIALGTKVWISGAITNNVGSNYVTFNTSTNAFSSATQLDASGVHAIITTDGTNLYFIDATTTQIKIYQSFDSGSTFSSAIVLVTSLSPTISTGGMTSASVVGNSIGIEFQDTASPTNIKFQTYDINTPWIIQSTSCTGTGSTVNCAFASNTKAGSSLVVFAGSTATTTVSGVTDTQSLTYSQIVGSDVGTVGDSEAWWACHPSTAAADTVTVSYSLSVTATIILYELHGRPTGTSCGPSSSTGSSASSSTAAVSSYTPRANAFIIGALDSSCQVACTITAGSGYSLDFNVAINAVNDFTTEYFWNVATADTTPYTFSVASAYNEISVAFYDLTWKNETFAPSTAFSPAFTPNLVLSRAFGPSFSASAKFNQGLNLHPFLPTFTLSPFFDFFRGLTPPPILLVPQPDYTAYFAMAIMFIFVVLILIKKRR